MVIVVDVALRLDRRAGDARMSSAAELRFPTCRFRTRQSRAQDPDDLAAVPVLLAGRVAPAAEKSARVLHRSTSSIGLGLFTIAGPWVWRVDPAAQDVDQISQRSWFAADGDNRRALCAVGRCHATALRPAAQSPGHRHDHGFAPRRAGHDSGGAARLGPGSGRCRLQHLSQPSTTPDGSVALGLPLGEVGADQVSL